MNLQEQIGKRIKSLREERKITQEDLAWQSNLDRSYMNHVENGKRNISINSLEKIVKDGLKMTFSDFFNHEIFNGNSNN